jgi:hypothetical protein
MKSAKSRRPRNPIAKAVRTPLYKMRVVANKRIKLLEKWSEAVIKQGKTAAGDTDERYLNF